jgi:hypothetical protein
VCMRSWQGAQRPVSAGATSQAHDGRTTSDLSFGRLDGRGSRPGGVAFRPAAGRRAGRLTARPIAASAPRAARRLDISTGKFGNKAVGRNVRSQEFG